MSKSDKYDGKPKPSDKRRMLTDEVHEPRKKPRRKKGKGRHHWHTGNFARLIHQMDTQRSGKPCFMKPVYVPEFDAMYCPNHMVWIEPKCKDALCQFCKLRPSSPKRLTA